MKVRGILERSLPFLKRKEQFVVLEISEGLLRATDFRVRFDEKRVEVGEVVCQNLKSPDENSVVSAATRLISRLGGAKRKNLILSADPRHAATIHSVVVLARDKPKIPIDDADLENRIAQGMWKLYDRERGRAAQKMKVTDLDVALTEVRAAGVKLDGHRILNPAGFKAKTIEFHLTQTFSPRSFIASLKGVFPLGRLALFAEGGVMLADVLRRATGRDSFFLVSVFDSNANVVVVDGNTVSSLRTVSWGKNNIVAALAESFSVSRAVAVKLFEIYLVRQASPPVLKRIEECLAEEFESFVETLEKPVSRFKPEAVYWFAPFALPEFLFSASMRGRLSWKAKFLPVAFELIRENLGFTVQLKLGAPPDASLLPALAALLEFYFLPPDDSLSRMARRHARWLIS